MGCLFVIFVSAFPRLGTLLIWIARPGLFDRAFGSWIWPLLGILLLPFTTLTYVVLWTSGGAGVAGWDWFWLALAALVDISHWASTGYANRDRVPGYSRAMTA